MRQLLFVCANVGNPTSRACGAVWGTFISGCRVFDPNRATPKSPR